MMFLTYSLFAWMVDMVFSHGRLMDPPARNSMWRFGFNNPVNYNDNELYCGGKMVQWVRNEGRCGVCGDPWHGSRPHEAGGKYANNIISRTYKEGDFIEVTVHLTANHLGWFEFRLCPLIHRNQKVDQKCLDKYLLRGADGMRTRFRINRGKYSSFFKFTLKLPNDLVCKQCVLQWKYKTGNTWDKDVKSGLYCLGCGPQEEFYNCADVSIEPKTIAKTQQTLNEKQLNSNGLSQLKTKEKAPKFEQKSGKQKLSMETTVAPRVIYTASAPLTRIWLRQSHLNRKHQAWLLTVRNNVSRNTNYVTKPFRNFKDRVSTRNKSWVTSLSNFINQRIATRNPDKKRIITIRTKNRGDIQVDSIYPPAKERHITEKRNYTATNSNSPNINISTKSAPVRSSNSIWRWWVNKITSPVKGSNRLRGNPLLNAEKRLVSRQQTTPTRPTLKTTAIKTTLATQPPCYLKTNQNAKSRTVISPVRSYHFGWRHQQTLQSSARRVTPMWTLKPVLKCRALIPLSGGMDNWCFVNCNANYCPHNICQCQRGISYMPLYSTNSFMADGNHLNRYALPRQKVWPKTSKSERNGQRHSRFSPVKKQDDNRSEVTRRFSCRAVGLYTRLTHFDKWCNRNCFAVKCPAFICQCTRH